MSLMSEFKEFAVKGNVMDLAVGVIIGGAFGKIVDSVVSDLIMPMVGNNNKATHGPANHSNSTNIQHPHRRRCKVHN